MSNPEMREWLVPISRVVHHAIQPGTIRVKAGSQAEAISLARSALDFGHTQSVEYEPVSEIQDASAPEIHDDLDESDVLPVDNSEPDVSPPSTDMQPEIIVSATAAEEAVEMLNEIMDELEKPTGDITSDMVNKMRIYYLAEITEALKGAIVAHHDPQRRGIGNRIVVGTIDETGDGDDEDAGAAEPLEAEAGQ